MSWVGEVLTTHTSFHEDIQQPCSGLCVGQILQITISGQQVDVALTQQVCPVSYNQSALGT